MNTIDVPIIKKTYELHTLLHALTKQIAKHERYTVWQRCQLVSLDIMEQLIRVGYTSPSLRHQGLVDTSVSLDVLKLLIRLCHDCNTIDKKSYFKVQALLDEIGRMLGGWLKSLKNTTRQ